MIREFTQADLARIAPVKLSLISIIKTHFWRSYHLFHNQILEIQMQKRNLSVHYIYLCSTIIMYVITTDQDRRKVWKSGGDSSNVVYNSGPSQGLKIWGGT